MKPRSQFGMWWCGLALSAALLGPGASAQGRPSSDRPAPRQQAPAPQSRDASRPARNDRPSGSYHPQNAPRGGYPQNAPRENAARGGNPQNGPRGGNANRSSTNQDHRSANDSRPRGNASPSSRDNGGNRNDRPQNSYRQQTQAAPPPNVQERLRNMTPQERSRLLENQRRFNQLPAQKQQDMKRAAENWSKLTPEQRSHLRNDVLPKWQQLPADRQRAIQQRLGVLQNMPESARNRHLNDPNFTRGMNEEDRQMLRDLSHEHVGAPDQPQPQEQ